MVGVGMIMGVIVRVAMMVMCVGVGVGVIVMVMVIMQSSLAVFAQIAVHERVARNRLVAATEDHLHQIRMRPEIIGHGHLHLRMLGL